MIVVILMPFEHLEAKMRGPAELIAYVLGPLTYPSTTQRDGTLLACGGGVYDSHINEYGINFNLS